MQPKASRQEFLVVHYYVFGGGRGIEGLTKASNL